MSSMIHFQTEFNERFKTGDKIKVMMPKYKLFGVYFSLKEEYWTREYTIGRTDLDDSHGQVELFCNYTTMIVEYQWFNEELTQKNITHIK